MSDSVRKVYVGVQAVFDTGGNITPQVIEWENGQKYEVDRVLDVRRAASTKAGGSGTMDVRNRSISKRGSSSLRRTLFLVMSVILQNSPPDEPVYQFMDKKRSEGKPYKVYMMAAANKFLRIYYARGCPAGESAPPAARCPMDGPGSLEVTPQCSFSGRQRNYWLITMKFTNNRCEEIQFM